jgi:hypothetical protein
MKVTVPILTALVPRTRWHPQIRSLTHLAHLSCDVKNSKRISEQENGVRCVERLRGCEDVLQYLILSLSLSHSLTPTISISLSLFLALSLSGQSLPLSLFLSLYLFISLSVSILLSLALGCYVKEEDVVRTDRVCMKMKSLRKT